MKKIVIITFESYVKEAHPYCLETLDYIASNGSIIEVEIIDYHAKKTEPSKKTDPPEKTEPCIACGVFFNAEGDQNLCSPCLHVEYGESVPYKNKMGKWVITKYAKHDCPKCDNYGCSCSSLKIKGES